MFRVVLLLLFFLLFFFVFFVVVFSVLFSTVITLLGKDRPGLCASRPFAYSFYKHPFLLFFSSSLYQGLTAACDCDTPWTVILTFLQYVLFHYLTVITKNLKQLYLVVN